MVLFILRKPILQKRMCSHPMGLDVWFMVGQFVYFRTSCVWTMKALVRLRECAGSPEPSLIAYVISTIISWAGSFEYCCYLQDRPQLPLELILIYIWSYIHSFKNLLFTIKQFILYLSQIMRKSVLPYMNNKDADQPAHPHSLISIFVVRCLDSTIYILPKSKMSRV